MINKSGLLKLNLNNVIAKYRDDPYVTDVRVRSCINDNVFVKVSLYNWG